MSHPNNTIPSLTPSDLVTPAQRSIGWRAPDAEAYHTWFAWRDPAGQLVFPICSEDKAAVLPWRPSRPADLDVHQKHSRFRLIMQDT